MFELKVTSEFASAHNLRYYDGNCENLHGHNWQVFLYVRGETLQPKTEMLVDFKVLKHELRAIMKHLDHTYLNELAPFDQVNPTSENLARYIFQQMSQALLDHAIDNAYVYKVEVYETPTASASYMETP
ncbi:6-carboxytetrahydropterin synthase QueD [Chrysiogenes arsenatis]|uniref:6-carboxytetrahydropterin synthase QueD n=1 Tax=Chrysiogenes arsenatis TaxID=309797 RepID=UPI00041D710A|nr:6-carboxytetrahydropterin synthase QueD [Chrysiogenes arsenatis]